MHKAVCYALKGLILAVVSLQVNLAVAYPKHTPKWTKVERRFLENSGRQSSYPHEYIPVLETRNQYELGNLAALRFIEWVKDHPRGVISLTSGATPEYFIKFLYHYKKNWHKAAVQEELRSYGINLKKFPDTSNLRMVQIEEFYPMSPKHHQKVSNYLRRHYVNILNLKPENVLLMDLGNKGIVAEKGMKVVFMSGKIDLSILKHKPNSQLESWQQQALRELQGFCATYEQGIRDWGGIDFFLGGISYAGHLGFNQPGGSFESKTQLVNLDYNTAAHAAKDLGGMEHARGKIGITIGLGTITLKPNAVMILLAAGDAKAEVIKNGVETPLNKKYPTTVLQNYPNSRFYITSGAAKHLQDRHLEDIKLKAKNGWSQKLLEDVIVEIALLEKKAILSLNYEDIKKHEIGKLLTQNPPKDLPAILQDVHAAIERNLDAGTKLSNVAAHKILHTGPHHDDIMLAYYPLTSTLINHYQNHFVYFTSGYNSVSDHYIKFSINRASDWWLNDAQTELFNTPYEKIIGKFRTYFDNQDQERLGMLDSMILLKHMISVYQLKDVEELKAKIRWLKDDYFPSKHAGSMDDNADMKLLKGMMRESEVDRLWSLQRVDLKKISHMRSKFYAGKEFMKTPRIDADVQPFVELYNSFRPDIITVADDPQSAPPVTHYKTLQIVAQALRAREARSNPNLQIWGYRNVWFKYRVNESNAYVPVSAAMLDAQKMAFTTCFNTQKDASFPSPFFEGDFSTLSSLIQQEQLLELKTLLGRDYFDNHRNPEIRDAKGMIFINRMTLDNFFARAEDLNQAIELEQSYETVKS